MRIDNNEAAFNTWTDYTSGMDYLQASVKRISSGSRLTTDDPAGAGISDRLNSQIEGIAARLNNIQSNISAIQTKDGYLKEATESLSGMLPAAVKAKGGTATEGDVANMEAEFSTLQDGLAQLSSESLNIDNDTVIGTIDTYTYDDNNKLVGSLHTEITWGEIIDSKDGINVDSENAVAAVMKAIEFVSGLRVDNIAELSTEQSDYGSLLLEQAKTMSARSSYSDVNTATESTMLAKRSVLEQSSMAMLAQANTMSAMPLSLLGV